MIKKKDARRIKGKGKKKEEKNACKAAGIDNSQEKHARAKVRKMESKAEIKGTERKREEEIKRAVKKRLGDEERIGALFYTYRPHSTEVVAAARNYERGGRLEKRVARREVEGERGGAEGLPEQKLVVSAGRKTNEDAGLQGEERVVRTSALSLINAVFLPFRFLARLGFGDEEL